ncbi:hypothetical protein [Burkholderia cenocepacia]|nr:MULTISPECIES: hypothetical protein [Burkholderia cepacia complex]
MVLSFLDAIAQVSRLRFEYFDEITWRDTLQALHAGRIDIMPDIAWGNVSMSRISSLPTPPPAQRGTATSHGCVARSSSLAPLAPISSGPCWTAIPTSALHRTPARYLRAVPARRADEEPPHSRQRAGPVDLARTGRADERHHYRQQHSR